MDIYAYLFVFLLLIYILFFWYGGFSCMVEGKLFFYIYIHMYMHTIFIAFSLANIVVDTIGTVMNNKDKTFLT